MNQYPLQNLKDSVLHGSIQLQVKSPPGGQRGPTDMPFLTSSLNEEHRDVARSKGQSVYRD